MDLAFGEGGRSSIWEGGGGGVDLARIWERGVDLAFGKGGWI